MAAEASTLPSDHSLLFEIQNIIIYKNRICERSEREKNEFSHWKLNSLDPYGFTVFYGFKTVNFGGLRFYTVSKTVSKTVKFFAYGFKTVPKTVKILGYGFYGFYGFLRFYGFQNRIRFQSLDIIYIVTVVYRLS